MKTPIDPETAEVRIVRKFNKLFVPLIELCDAIRNLEPYSMAIDDIVLTKKPEGVVSLELKAKPLTITIIDDHKRMTLQVSRVVKAKTS